MTGPGDIVYHLPEELIAAHPAEKREGSRLLVVDRKNGTLADRQFPDILEYLNPGDCLVMNETKVFRARLRGTLRPSGKNAEVLLVSRTGPRSWTAMVKNSRRIPPGSVLEVSGVALKILDAAGEHRAVEFETALDFDAIDAIGETPLPPYIVKKRRNRNEPVLQDGDAERYQSVVARTHGSVAAPTASLHFTKDILSEAERKGVRRAFVTLHVGPGTFKPIGEGEWDSFRIHSEAVDVPDETVRAVRNTRETGGRVVAVGTTVARSLETMARDSDDPARWKAFRGETDLFIRGEFPFRATDALLTNFHMPRSTLLLLVQSFGGRELLRRAYEHAVRERYRFLSYGDAMLIL